MNPNTFVHFELPADDVERAKKFYADLFGWKTEETPGFPGYWSVMVSDDENDMHGALQKREDFSPMPMFYVGVESIDAMVEKLQQLGGRVTAPKMPVPQMGWLAIFTDTEGNTFGLWQTDAEAK